MALKPHIHMAEHMLLPRGGMAQDVRSFCMPSTTKLLTRNLPASCGHTHNKADRGWQRMAVCEAHVVEHLDAL